MFATHPTTSNHFGPSYISHRYDGGEKGLSNDVVYMAKLTEGYLLNESTIAHRNEKYKIMKSKSDGEQPIGSLYLQIPPSCRANSHMIRLNLRLTEQIVVHDRCLEENPLCFPHVFSQPSISSLISGIGYTWIGLVRSDRTIIKPTLITYIVYSDPSFKIDLELQYPGNSTPNIDPLTRNLIISDAKVTHNDVCLYLQYMLPGVKIDIFNNRITISNVTLKVVEQIANLLDNNGIVAMYIRTVLMHLSQSVLHIDKNQNALSGFLSTYARSATDLEWSRTTCLDLLQGTLPSSDRLRADYHNLYTAEVQSIIASAVFVIVKTTVIEYLSFRIDLIPCYIRLYENEMTKHEELYDLYLIYKNAEIDPVQLLPTGGSTPLRFARGEETSLRFAREKEASLRFARGEETSLRFARGEETSLRFARGEETSLRFARGEETSLRFAREKEASLRFARGAEASNGSSKYDKLFQYARASHQGNEQTEALFHSNATLQELREVHPGLLKNTGHYSREAMDERIFVLMFGANLMLARPNSDWEEKEEENLDVETNNISAPSFSTFSGSNAPLRERREAEERLLTVIEILLNIDRLRIVATPDNPLLKDAATLRNKLFKEMMSKKIPEEELPETLDTNAESIVALLRLLLKYR